MLDRDTAYGYTWKCDPPILWSRHSLTVVRDGYTEDGIRIHFVTEDVKDGTITDNALVFGNYR